MQIQKLNLDEFVSTTVILPVMNETESVQTTVKILETSSGADIGEYLFVVCEKTSPEALAACRKYVSKNPARFSLIQQTIPFGGGAIREGFAKARCSHVVMMASDLETDPHLVTKMIERAKTHPARIITASRWTQSGSFHGYHPLKLLANLAFQKVFSLLYGTTLSDLTYGFRLFPRAVLEQIDWEETRHAFYLETILKPLRLGVEVEEVAGSWVQRSEGESKNNLRSYPAYFRIGLKTRFLPTARWRKNK